jgi:geranylgeranyl pyrophosphate synthase
LEASIAIGAYLAEADESALDAIGSFGRSVGLAFQIVDDILDETAEVATLGKTPGKDRRQGKATYPGVHGIDRSWTMVGRLTADARRSARQLGEGGLLLIGLADSLESRVR